MSNKSILDQIITNQKVEEIAKLNAVEIIASLFNELNERERNVLTCRFGLHGQGKETLENIGKAHNLTRERIRQIETSGVKKLKQLKNLDEHISGLKKVISELLEEHGGLMEKKYLLNNLVNFSIDGANSKAENAEVVHKSHLDFLISKLLHNEFEEVNNSKVFKESFKLKYQTMEHMEELASELLAAIKEAKKIMNTEELINLSKNLDYYKAHEEKLKTENNVDISAAINNKLFKENIDLINEHKPLYSILQAHRNIEQNKFGDWGVDDWREINPKTINDKIYLVLKNVAKHMHFVEIAEKINEIGFDDRKANPATVHNELILDDKYVLIGRGLYTLKEWGYKTGTVADVISEILIKSGGPLDREMIVNKVLEQRQVKKSTIVLALMDKTKFEKTENEKYKIRQ